MNTARNIFIDPQTSQLRPFWRSQLFLFDNPSAPVYSAREGSKLLLVFLLLEAIVRPLFAAGSQWLSVTEKIWWPLVQVTSLTILVCWLVTSFARVPLSQLGLYSWFRWSKTEKFYFLQTIPLAIIIFSFFTSASLKVLWTRADLWEIALFNFVPRMIWGVYQEILYRGLLQTELVRRWGTRMGLLVGNLIFTFGPLHAYHFLTAQGNPSHLWIFAAIFSIGLLFAILYQRSGNLWIIGIMHGLGDWFIDGLAQVSKLAG
jgi:uncharacterized protein